MKKSVKIISCAVAVLIIAVGLTASVALILN